MKPYLLCQQWPSCPNVITQAVAYKLAYRKRKRPGRGVFARHLAERVGFEPTVPCGTPDFESGTFDHSATSPVNRAVILSA